MTTLTCNNANCGKQFERHESQVRIASKYYCSLPCRFEAQKLRVQSDLAFVKEHFETMSVRAMAKALGRSKCGLEYQIREWRRKGEGIPGTMKPKKNLFSLPNSEFFDWKDYRSGIIAPDTIAV